MFLRWDIRSNVFRELTPEESDGIPTPRENRPKSDILVRFKSDISVTFCPNPTVRPGLFSEGFLQRIVKERG